MKIELFLGDRAFHSRYGKNLSAERIGELMRYAADKGLVGLAAGEERSLGLAAEVKKNHPHLKIMYHTDIAFVIAYTHRGRCISSPDTACAGLKKEIIRRGLHSDVFNDKITGKFLDSEACRKVMPLDINSLEYYKEGEENNLELIQRFKPDCVSIGGDVLDCAVYQGMDEALTKKVRGFIGAVRERAADCLLTSYILPMADYSALDDLFNGYLVPYNALGGGLLPNPSAAEEWLKKQNKPIFAMHMLHEGKIHPYTAFGDAHEAGFIRGAVIGASSEKQIDSLVEAWKRWNS